MFEDLNDFLRRTRQIREIVSFLGKQINVFQGTLPDFIKILKNNLENFLKSLNEVDSVGTLFWLCFFNSDEFFLELDRILDEFKKIQNFIQCDFIVAENENVQDNLVHSRYILNPTQLTYQARDENENSFTVSPEKYSKIQRLFSNQNLECKLYKLYNLNQLMRFNEYICDPDYYVDESPADRLLCSYTFYGNKGAIDINVLVVHANGDKDSFPLKDFVTEKGGNFAELASVVRGRVVTSSNRKSYDHENDPLKKFLDQHARRLNHSKAIDVVLKEFSEKLTFFSEKLRQVKSNLGSRANRLSTESESGKSLVKSEFSADDILQKSGEESRINQNPLFLFFYFLLLLSTCVVSVPFVLYRNQSEHNCWSLFWHSKKNDEGKQVEDCGCFRFLSSSN